MTAPAEPRILAEVGGLAVAKRGPLVLVVVTPSGNRVLKHGNPFHGELVDLEAVLDGAVFGQRR